MSRKAKLEIIKGRTPEDTEVHLMVSGDFDFDKLVEIQRHVFEKELPKVIPGFAGCGNCKSGLGRFIIDIVDSRVNPAEVSVLGLRGKVHGLELENRVLRHAIREVPRANPVVEVEVEF